MALIQHSKYAQRLIKQHWRQQKSLSNSKCRPICMRVMYCLCIICSGLRRRNYDNMYTVAGNEHPGSQHLSSLVAPASHAQMGSSRVISVNCIACCTAVLVDRITGLARPSVRPSVSCVQAPNSRTKRVRKIKIVVNVPQGGSNRCASFQLKRSKVTVTVAQVYADDRIICCHRANIFFQFYPHSAF